ncbi:MAG: T9SS type A sorting domain-containing protein [Bacteroidota bacterium]
MRKTLGVVDWNTRFAISSSAIIDVYNPETEIWDIDQLSSQRYGAGFTGFENRFIGFSGLSFTSGISSTVDIFTCDEIVNTINTRRFDRQLQLFPNPSNDWIEINLDEIQSMKDVKYQIIGPLGNIQRSGSYKSPKIDTSQLPNGQFYLRLFSNEGVNTIPFQIMK